MATSQVESGARRVLSSLGSFSEFAAPRRLRPYQVEAGEAIVRSVLGRKGRTITVCMARQSGKNELSAQLEAYLLNLFAFEGGQIVKAAPSFKPQVVNSMLRLQDVLEAPFSRGRWAGRQGYMLELGRARVIFFSADPAASIVGATASILLEVDEAQDVDEDVYFRGLRPMASTTRATTVLYGTPWTDDSILETQRRLNIAEEKRTGERLNFEAPWTVLAAISPPYREFVQGEIDRLGESHPTILTQYKLQPVAGAGRLFPPRLLERMRGAHPRQTEPAEGSRYVMGIDVAGQVADPTSLRSANRVLNDRDETVVTVIEIGRSGPSPETGADDEEARPSAAGARSEPAPPVGSGGETGNLPGLRVVQLYRWSDVSHAEQYERLLRLIREVWDPARVCVDATGIGAGLASFLVRALPTRVEPVVFTVPEKSRMGFGLLAAAETGRLTVWAEGKPEREGRATTGGAPLTFRGGAGDADLRELWRQ